MNLNLKFSILKATGLAILLLLSLSCTRFVAKDRKAPEGPIPDKYTLYAHGPERPDKWWKSFNDDELDSLVEKALEGNLSLKESYARLRQAKALAVQAGAQLLPSVAGSAGTSHYRQKTENTRVNRQTIKDYELGLTSSYELDLWGKIRSEQEAASLEVTASQEDIYTAAMTLAAEVTTQWVNIISQRMQKRLLEGQLKTDLTYLELVELRFRKGMASALDVLQQKQVVEKIKARMPLVEVQESLLLNSMALLLGRAPAQDLKITRSELPVLDELPATGIPADVLSNRPDIRSKGLRLKALDWKVASARADRLPSLNLSATAKLSAESLDLLLDNWLLGLASSLTAPIFDGGRRKAEVDRQKALADQNLASYRATVLTAIKEVEDALISEQKQKEHIAALEKEIDAARGALDEARERYRKGLNDYLPVLTQILSVQNLELDLIQKRTALILDRVNLHRALGGTWMTELKQSAKSIEKLIYKG